MPNMVPSHTSYYNGVFGNKDRREVIKKAVYILKNYEFEVIAVRGVSGLMIGSILAHKMQKELTVVRKRCPDTHSSHEIEGFSGQYRYVIVDDLIATGNTLRTIIDTMVLCTDAKCVGIYLYKEPCYGNGAIATMPGVPPYITYPISYLNDLYLPKKGKK